MGRFYSIENLTREQVEVHLDQTAEHLLRKPHDRLVRLQISKLMQRLAELDGKQEDGRRLKLRNHPAMTLNSGFCVWPPVWSTTRNDGQKTPAGEIGYLEKVLHGDDWLSGVIFLVMRHNDAKFMGAMLFNDRAFSRQLYILLTSKVGLSIREIGDLDVSHLL